MIQYIDPETGKLIAESLTDYTRKKIANEYQSLDNFLSDWNKEERKDIIIKELERKGIPVDELKKEVGANVDEFDTILHVAFNKEPLTRSERAKRVKENNLLSKYEGKAREVLEALLDKYADQGSLAIDDIGDLEVSPFNEFGTPIEIVEDIFGGRENYLKAVRELQEKLYNISV